MSHFVQRITLQLKYMECASFRCRPLFIPFFTRFKVEKTRVLGRLIRKSVGKRLAALSHRIESSLPQVRPDSTSGT